MGTRPANNDYPVLDGISPSWADVVVRLSAEGSPILECKDIKSINTNRSVDLGEQKAGGRVKKRTAGDGKQDASMTVYYDSYLKLMRALKASPKCPRRGNIALVRYVHFGINYAYTPVGSDEIFERRIKGCCVISDPINGSEGTDATTVDLGLSAIEITQVIDGEEVALI
jgi:hypothetical protein